MNKFGCMTIMRVHFEEIYQKLFIPALGFELMTFQVKSSRMGITFITEIGISTNDPSV